LRADIAERLRPYAERRAEEEFRRAAVDAAVSTSKVTVPEEVSRARAEEMWERMEHQLAHQGIDAEVFAKAQGKSREELIEEARSDADQALRREAVLEAVADAEGIGVSEDDIVEALGSADDGGELTDRKRQKLLKRLRSSGREKLLAAEIRLRKAADTIVESAKPIPVAQAEARDKIWTPDKERAEGEGELWTPGR
jgi:trigger factor